MPLNGCPVSWITKEKFTQQNFVFWDEMDQKTISTDVAPEASGHQGRGRTQDEPGFLPPPVGWTRAASSKQTLKSNNQKLTVGFGWRKEQKLCRGTSPLPTPNPTQRTGLWEENKDRGSSGGCVLGRSDHRHRLCSPRLQVSRWAWEVSEMGSPPRGAERRPDLLHSSTPEVAPRNPLGGVSTAPATLGLGPSPSLSWTFTSRLNSMWSQLTMLNIFPEVTMNFWIVQVWKK